METSKLRVNDRIFPVQAYHMYVTSYERWSDGYMVSSGVYVDLVSTQLSSNGDDGIVVCIQRVYANSKWVCGCTCYRRLPGISGPLVLQMPATQTAVKDWSLIVRGYSQCVHVCYFHTRRLFGYERYVVATIASTPIERFHHVIKITS